MTPDILFIGEKVVARLGFSNQISGTGGTRGRGMSTADMENGADAHTLIAEILRKLVTPGNKNRNPGKRKFLAFKSVCGRI